MQNVAYSQAGQRRPSISQRTHGDILNSKVVPLSSQKWNTIVTLFLGRCLLKRLGTNYATSSKRRFDARYGSIRSIHRRCRARLCGHTSNVLGVRNPIEDIIRIAHENGARVLLDAAQGAPHCQINMAELGADMMALSAHKCVVQRVLAVCWLMKRPSKR